jgi:hypothetical protein
MPVAANGSLLPIELLQQERPVMNGPAMNGRVVYVDATFRHHLLEIAQAQAVSKIPPDAQQDHRAVEMAAFEHCAPPECVGGVRRTKLLKGMQ